MTRARTPAVAVGSLGGTITMTSDESPGVAAFQGGGVVPTAGGDDLVAAVPALAEIAVVSGSTLRKVPGASLGFHDILECLDWARRSVDAGAAGVVLAQGTDTLEESAYLLDLFWDRSQPLVLTGAMRHPEMTSADGPGNLLAAVTTAADTTMRDTGVLVVMNDEIHLASRVRKTDPTALDAFRSPGVGPMGRVVEHTAVAAWRVDRVRPLPTPTAGDWPRVGLVECTLDDRGEPIRAAADGYEGLVVAAFGVGHVSEPAAQALSDAVARIPVVVASRTGAGTTVTGTYGFPGSESDLLRRGAVLAGSLDPRKSRLLLGALLCLGRGRDEVQAEFARRGGGLTGAPER